MKKTLLFLAVFTWSFLAKAQKYNDDFESRTVNTGIAAQTTEWSETFGGGRPGRSFDCNVVATKAYSGTQSLYFLQNFNQRPDVNLNFGNIYSLGQFEMSFWMFVPATDAAYFDIQGSQQIGQDVVLKFNTDAYGNFYLKDASNSEIAAGTHPVSEWFKIDLKVDLTLNKWAFSLNDVLVKNFESNVNALASMRVFPLNEYNNLGASYWIDDVYFKYTDYDYKDFNAQLYQASYTGGQFANTDVEFSVVIRNLGSNEINRMKLGYIYNNVLYTDEIEGLSLFTGSSYSHTFSSKVKALAGTHYAELMVLQVEGKSDEVAIDDSKILKIRPIVPNADKMILIESAVSTVCGTCPSVYVSMLELEKSLEPYVVDIQLHSLDPMDASENAKAFFETYATKLPYIIADRETSLEPNPSNIATQLLKKLEEIPYGIMQVGASSNADSTEIKVTVAYILTQEILEEGWRVACAMVENNINENLTTYNQRNDYWNGAYGEMGGYENLPRIISSRDMTYRNVLRNYQPSFEGDLAIEKGKKLGDTVLVSFNFILDATWKKNALTIIPILIDQNSTVNNAFRISITKAIKNGEISLGMLPNKELDFQLLSVFPNPANEDFTIIFNSDISNAKVELLNINGLVVWNTQASAFYAKQALKATTQGLPSGCYFLRIQNERVLRQYPVLISH